MSEETHTLADIIRVLSVSYGDMGIAIWLGARNSNLDGCRPLDLLAHGQMGDVMQAAERIEGGS